MPQPLTQRLPVYTATLDATFFAGPAFRTGGRVDLQEHAVLGKRVAAVAARSLQPFQPCELCRPVRRAVVLRFGWKLRSVRKERFDGRKPERRAARIRRASAGPIVGTDKFLTGHLERSEGIITSRERITKTDNLMLVIIVIGTHSFPQRFWAVAAARKHDQDDLYHADFALRFRIRRGADQVRERAARHIER